MKKAVIAVLLGLVAALPAAAQQGQSSPPNKAACAKWYKRAYVISTLPTECPVYWNDDTHHVIFRTVYYLGCQQVTTQPERQKLYDDAVKEVQDTKNASADQTSFCQTMGNYRRDVIRQMYQQKPVPKFNEK